MMPDKISMALLAAVLFIAVILAVARNQEHAFFSPFQLRQHALTWP